MGFTVQSLYCYMYTIVYHTNRPHSSSFLGFICRILPNEGLRETLIGSAGIQDSAAPHASYQHLLRGYSMLAVAWCNVLPVSQGSSRRDAARSLDTKRSQTSQAWRKTGRGARSLGRGEHVYRPPRFPEAMPDLLLEKLFVDLSPRAHTR